MPPESQTDPARRASLDEMGRAELVGMARGLKIKNIEALSREELIDKVLAASKRAGRKPVSPFREHLKHMYGLAGVVVGVLGILFTWYYATKPSGDPLDGEGGSATSEPRVEDNSPLVGGTQDGGEQEAGAPHITGHDNGVDQSGLLMEVESIVEDVLSREPIHLAEPNPRRVALSQRPDIDLRRLDYSGFEAKEEKVIWDLSDWQQVDTVRLLTGGIISPQDLREYHSPATVTVRLRIQRKNESARVYPIRAQTSGYEIFSRCDSQPGDCVVVTNDKAEQAGGLFMKDRLIEIDVSRYPPRRDFWIETRRTYWNAFQREEQSFVGSIVRPGLNYLDLLVIVPRDRPIQKYKLTKAVTDGTKTRVLDKSKELVLSDKAGKYIHWRIRKPEAGWSYRLDWDW